MNAVQLFVASAGLSSWEALASISLLIIACLLSGIMLLLGWAFIAARKKARVAQETALELQREVLALLADTRSFIQQADVTISDVSKQLAMLQTLFEACEQAGIAVRSGARTVRLAADMLADATERRAAEQEADDKANVILEWAELGIAAWHLWHTNR